MTNVAADSPETPAASPPAPPAKPDLRLVALAPDGVSPGTRDATEIELYGLRAPLYNPDGTPTLGTAEMASDEIVSDVMQVYPSQARRWLVENGIDPDTMRVVKDVGGFTNRRIVKSDVLRIGDDIKAGAWRYNDTPARFLKKGWLGDGQHRMLACAYANKPIIMRVTRGLTEADIETVDTGRARKFADVLQMKGYANARQVASAAKLIYHYENGTMLQAGAQVSHPQLKKTIRKHPYVQDAVRDVGRVKAFQPASVLGMVYTLAHERSAKKAEYWLISLQEGLNFVSGGDPVKLLRDRLLNVRGDKDKLRQVELAALVVKSWNAYKAQESLRTLTWTSKGRFAEPFPEIA